MSWSYDTFRSHTFFTCSHLTFTCDACSHVQGGWHLEVEGFLTCFTTGCLNVCQWIFSLSTPRPLSSLHRTLLTQGSYNTLFLNAMRVCVNAFTYFPGRAAHREERGTQSCSIHQGWLHGNRIQTQVLWIPPITIICPVTASQQWPSPTICITCTICIICTKWGDTHLPWRTISRDPVSAGALS